MDIFKKLDEKYDKYFDYLNQNMIVNQIIKRGVTNPRIIDVIKQTKRHLFVPDSLKSRAYDDCALEILPGQTISQPYIVSLMIDLLDIKETDKVLEIGTGTGWQTVILSKLSKEVYSIDISDKLYQNAKRMIDEFNCKNVVLKIGDGNYGLSEFEPYDKIIVSCATTKIPENLIKQLKPNGKMVLPVGNEYAQKLNVVIKNDDGSIKILENIDVIFVMMKKIDELREIN